MKDVLGETQLMLSILSKTKEALIQRKNTPMLMDKWMKTPHTGNFHLIKQFWTFNIFNHLDNRANTVQMTASPQTMDMCRFQMGMKKPWNRHLQRRFSKNWVSFIFIICCAHRVLFQLHLMWSMTFMNTKEESSGVIVAGGVWTMVCWLWAMGKTMVNPNR